MKSRTCRGVGRGKRAHCLAGCFRRKTGVLSLRRGPRQRLSRAWSPAALASGLRNGMRHPLLLRRASLSTSAMLCQQLSVRWYRPLEVWRGWRWHAFCDRRTVQWEAVRKMLQTWRGLQAEAGPARSRVPLIDSEGRISSLQQFPLMTGESYATMVADSSVSVSTIHFRLLPRLSRFDMTGCLVESRLLSSLRRSFPR